jgi:hypothetical protein
MGFLRFRGRSSTPGTSMVAVIALLMASGCAGVEVHSPGSGAFHQGSAGFGHGAGVLALDWGKCDQSDSTVTCCLKNHPGQYERCGATPPKQPQPINRPPPLLRPPDENEEETKEQRQERCLGYYVRCIEKIGQKQGSLYGTSHCKDCYGYCERHGFWPARMNRKKCPGAGP